MKTTPTPQRERRNGDLIQTFLDGSTRILLFEGWRPDRRAISVRDEQGKKHVLEFEMAGQLDTPLLQTTVVALDEVKPQTHRWGTLVDWLSAEEKRQLEKTIHIWNQALNQERREREAAGEHRDTLAKAFDLPTTLQTMITGRGTEPLRRFFQAQHPGWLPFINLRTLEARKVKWRMMLHSQKVIFLKRLDDCMPLVDGSNLVETASSNASPNGGMRARNVVSWELKKGNHGDRVASIEFRNGSIEDIALQTCLYNVINKVKDAPRRRMTWRELQNLGLLRGTRGDANKTGTSPSKLRDQNGFKKLEHKGFIIHSDSDIYLPIRPTNGGLVG